MKNTMVDFIRIDRFIMEKRRKISLDEKTKNLWKFFIILFLINFIIINWSDIAWLFNYKFITRGLLGIFEQNKTQATEDSPQTLKIVEDLKKTDWLKRENIGEISKEARIKIPKIEIEAPIIFPKGNQEKDFQAALKKGVLFYPQSALPGEGTAIILGHSAPPNWPKINFDWIFNDLYKLNPEDKIYVDFNGKQYVFSTTKTFFLQKGQELPPDLTNSDKSYIILLSCWPPGKDQQRIGILAELIS